MRIPRKSSIRHSAVPKASKVVVTDEFHHVPVLGGARVRQKPLLAPTQLRSIFNNIVEEPVPDELLRLLQLIDARQDVEESNGRARASFG